MNITVFILALTAMVVLHEIGHFVAAKATGMRVERFSLFFGRALISRRRGETEYMIGWLPLGGYVKISGMSPEEELDPEVAPRAYCRQPTWKRVTVILAGPMVNIVCALALFAAFFMSGVPATSNEIAAVIPDTPAAVAGLVPGDTLVGIDQVRADGRNVDALREGIIERPGEQVNLQIEREGAPVSVPAVLASVDGAGQLGVQFGSYKERSGPLDASWKALDMAWWQTKTAGVGIWRLATESGAHKELTTVVGITAAYNEIAGLGFALYFIGAVSLLLGLFNLLPLLPLDGGHILFALLERLRGRNFSTRTYQATIIAGLALLLVGLAFGLINDASRISTGNYFG